MTQHPAGWYPRPDGTQGYWDGSQWTHGPTPGAPGAGAPDFVQGQPQFHGYVQGQPQGVHPGHMQGDYGAPYGNSDPQPAKRPWFKKKRVLIPAFLVVAIGVLSQLGGEDGQVAAPAPTETASIDVTPSPEATPEETTTEEPEGTEPEPEGVVEAEPAPEPVEEVVAEAPEAAEPDMSVSQEQAIRSARNYLSFTAFSRTGLIEQLEYEGFSTEHATIAVDNVTVDWNEQAALSAESYLEFTSFSRSGMIDQLEFEGFTREQAEYGATAVGL